MYKPIRSADLVSGGNIIKQGEHFTLTFQLFDVAGQMVDVTGKTITVKIANTNGVVLESIATAGTEGKISFDVNEDIGHGEMRVEIKVSDGASVIQKYPADGWLDLRITQSLDDLGVGVINAVTVTQLRSEIAVVQKQLDAVVARETDSDAMSRQAAFNSVGVDKGNLKVRLDEDYNFITSQYATKLEVQALDDEVTTHLVDYVNVKSFGAVGDGITDDTIAINNAVQSMISGGILYFPKGTYIIDGRIILPSNTIITGAGKYITIIKVKNNALDVHVFWVDECTNVTLKDLSIDGNKANQTSKGLGVTFNRSHSCKAINVKIINQNGIGLGLSNSYNCDIVNCEASYCGDNRPGFWCDADLGVVPYTNGNLKFTNCDAHYNDLDGIILNVGNSTISDSRFTYNGQNPTGGPLGAGGIYNDRIQDNIKLINNYTAFNTEYGINGIFLNAIISNCVIRGNGLSGIFLRSTSKRIKISGCACHGNGKNPTTLNPTTWGKSGIQYDGVSFVSIIGCGCYDESATQTQKYGIQSMATTASNLVVIIGNNLKYNLTDDSNLGAGYAVGVHNTTNLIFANNI